MLSFLASIFKFILYLFKSRRKLLLKMAVLDKENEILKRQNRHRLKFTRPDKIFFSI